MFRFCLSSVPLLLFFAACGPSEEEQSAQVPPQPTIDMTAATAYGTVADVSGYLETINPHIMRIGELQQNYKEALDSARQGAYDRRGTFAWARMPPSSASARQDASDRRGTGRNLAAKATAVKPGFQTVLGELDTMQPPPMLAPFHRDTRKMVAALIDALGRIIEGWEVEQQGGEFEAVYRDAEARYEAANQLIVQLNTQMNRINTTLQEAVAAP